MKFETDIAHAKRAVHKFLDKALKCFEKNRDYIDRLDFYFEYSNLEIKGYTEDGEVLEYFNGGCHCSVLPPKKGKYIIGCYDKYYWFEYEK